MAVRNNNIIGSQDLDFQPVFSMDYSYYRLSFMGFKENMQLSELNSCLDFLQ